MNIPLKKEFDFFIENQEKLVEEYNNRVISIKDGKVIGDFLTEWEAFKETSKTHEAGTFLVQKVSSGAEAYTRCD